MSNRFISGGTIGSGGDISKDETSQDGRQELLMKKNAEWEAVQQELEAERKRREEQRVSAATGREQSLYDILQANKAAKQAAFEEQTKLKNQFRALDDDEVEFLDEVRAKKREEEEKVRRETEEGLKAFRERQKSGGGDVAVGTGENQDDGEGGDEWAVGGRKRKRVKEREVKGVKRKTADGDVAVAAREEAAKKKDDGSDGGIAEKSVEKESVPAAKEKKGPSLVAYGSDDSDDD